MAASSFPNILGGVNFGAAATFLIAVVLVAASHCVTAVESVSVAATAFEASAQNSSREKKVSSPSSSSFFHVIHFSDFHYDPFFGTEAAVGPCKSYSTTGGSSNVQQSFREEEEEEDKLTPYGRPGCDSSLIQIEEALKSANNTANRILDKYPGSTVLVLYTGDWMRHDMASLPRKHEVASEIMTTLSQLWQKYFPTTVITGHCGENMINGAGRILAAPHPTIPISLGNEDFIPDYHFNVARATNASTANQSESHQLLSNISTILSQHQILNSKDQHDNFSYCGFYSQDVKIFLPNDDARRSDDDGMLQKKTMVKVISLNSLVWAYSVNPSTVGLEDPCGQFKFLESTLAETRRRMMSANEMDGVGGGGAILLSHIPPDFFDQSFMTKYNSIVNAYSDIILSQFYGHIHRMTFLVSSGALTTSPVFIGGPITRVSNTNPCYERLRIDFEPPAAAGAGGGGGKSLGGAVTEVTQFYLSNQHVWTEGDTLPGAYNISSLSSKELYHFGRDKLRLGDTAAFKRWFTNYNGGLLDSGRLAEYEKCIKEPLHLCERFWACTVVSEGIWNASGCFL